MSAEIYRYSFLPSVPFEEVEASLVLAIMAAESLHGQAQVRLDVAHAVDPEKRCCVIDATTCAGRDVNRLFIGFFGQEFGQDAFQVERVGILPEVQKSQSDASIETEQGVAPCD